MTGSGRNAPGPEADVPDLSGTSSRSARGARRPRREEWDEWRRAGDLLFEIVFLARLGSETGASTSARRPGGSTRRWWRDTPRLRRRRREGRDGVRLQWRRSRRRSGRRAARRVAVRRSSEGPAGAPEGRPDDLEGGGLGFDWPRRDVLLKLDEEVGEFKAEVLREGAPKERIAHEIGDILFTVVNVARRLHVDPEAPSSHERPLPPPLRGGGRRVAAAGATSRRRRSRSSTGFGTRRRPPRADA